MMERDSEADQMAYAHALVEWGEAGGYEQETLWDQCTVAALGVPYEQAQWRKVTTLSGGEQKRLVLEALLRGPEEVLLLDEPDNYLDVPAKRWLEEALAAPAPRRCSSSATTASCSTASPTRIATLEPGAAGATLWVHPGRFSTYAQARERPQRPARGAAPALGRGARQAQDARADVQGQGEVQRRHGRRATRPPRPGWRSSSEAGPPQETPMRQHVKMRLKGGRTAKRAVVATDLELTGLMKPFDLEVWYGERVAVLGSNGSGKSHFLRLLARRRHATRSASTSRWATCSRHRSSTPASCGSARGCGRDGSPRPTSTRRCSGARCSRSCTAATSTGSASRARRLPGRSTATSWRGRASRRSSRCPGGQQARFQILLLELSGATLLLLDEPTDNLDLQSAEALEEGLSRFEGTVMAVTHDRWFARGFDRFLVFGSDGRVYESTEPVWDEKRVVRPR